MKGEVGVNVGPERVAISRVQAMVTELATLSMRSEEGVRMLGIHIYRRRTRPTRQLTQFQRYGGNT